MAKGLVVVTAVVIVAMLGAAGVTFVADRFFLFAGGGAGLLCSMFLILLFGSSRPRTVWKGETGWKAKIWQIFTACIIVVILAHGMTVVMAIFDQMTYFAGAAAALLTIASGVLALMTAAKAGKRPPQVEDSSKAQEQEQKEPISPRKVGTTADESATDESDGEEATEDDESVSEVVIDKQPETGATEKST